MQGSSMKDLQQLCNGTKHRTDRCTDFLFSVQTKPAQQEPAGSGFAGSGKKKRKTVLLLLMLIAGFSIQMNNTSASQRQDKIPAWSAHKTPCCAAGVLAWWPTAGTPELDC